MNLKIAKSKASLAKDVEGDNLPPRQPSKFQQTARYVVSVDHQVKSSFDKAHDAEAEASRIRGRFPKLTVEVSDARENSIDRLGPTVGKEQEGE